MKEIKLSQRLAAVAACVNRGDAVADIGTDHGYIPVWLAQNDIARRIIAADIKKGPLEHAKASANAYGVAGKIEFIKTDGLGGLGSEGLDTVILAGMGGETMLGILGRAPWTRTNGVRCVLQPQTKCDALVFWLASNGYGIRDAKLVRDDGRLYIVLLAQSGEMRETPLQLLMRRHDALLPDYLKQLIDKNRRAVEGLKISSDVDPEELKIQNDAYETLVRLKKETDQWPR